VLLQEVLEEAEPVLLQEVLEGEGLVLPRVQKTSIVR
jgi:hypothetical protein